VDHRLTHLDHRLTRRSLLACVAAVVASTATAGCDSALGASSTPSAPSRPPDDTPVASWRIDGDLDLPAVRAIRAPMLVIFADGSAIAEAAYQSRLDDTALTSLVTHLLSALKDPAATATRTTGPSIVDASTTVFDIWTGTGTLSVRAVGLDELRNRGVYGSALYDAADRLAAVYKTVTSTALPYLSDRVRVVTETVAEAGTTVTPWPAALALPTQPTGTDTAIRRSDLAGDAARSAVRLLIRDLDHKGAWPTYSTPDGHLVQASWRYLLPSETPPSPTPSTS